MSHEPKPSDDPKTSADGILGRAKRVASQVGDYARSDEAREKLEGVKQNAARLGGLASDGAKKLARGSKQAAAQAKARAAGFSESENVQVIKAKAKEDWDEIRGGSFRGSRLSHSPVMVGMAIFVLFPVGLFMLWKHPILSRNKKWWSAGGSWALMLVLALAGTNGKRNLPKAVSSTQTITSGDEEKVDGDPSGAVRDRADDFSGTDYTKGPNDEALVKREEVHSEDVVDYGEKHYSGPKDIWYKETGFIDNSGKFRRYGLREGFYDGAKKERYFREYWFGDVRQGPKTVWYYNRKMIWEGAFNEGKEHGPLTSWYPDGQIESKYYWANGNKHGMCVNWHKNGSKSYEGEFDHGVPIGKHLAWNEDGSPWKEQHYVAGKEDGASVEWIDGRPYVTRFDQGRVVFIPGESTVRAFLAKLDETAIDTRGAKIGFYIFRSQENFVQIFGQPAAGLVPKRISPEVKFEWLYRCSDGVVSMKVCNGLSFFVEKVQVTQLQ